MVTPLRAKPFSTRMDPFIQKIQQRLVNDKYHLVSKIGEGGFGAVYLGKDNVTGEEVALKLEHRDHEPSNLSLEFDWYEDFRSVHGFPRIDWYGWQDDFKVIVMELLGPSLEDVFAYCGGQFSLKTTLMLADQLLERLKEIHSRGYLHRDIKPSNFLLGTGRCGNVVYVTDFGLVEPFKEETEPRSKGKIQVSRRTVIGTVRYASIQGHVEGAQSPKDDLESLSYMLVYFMKGRLPWQGCRGKDDERNQSILDLKTQISPDELCTGLSREFAECLKHSKSLEPNKAPKYGKMQAMFKSLAAREGISYDNVYDWTERFLVTDNLG